MKFNRILLLAMVCFCLMTSLTPASPYGKSEANTAPAASQSCDAEGRAFLDKMGETLSPLMVDLMTASWVFYTTGVPGDMEALEMEMIAVYQDKDTFAKVKAFRDCVGDSNLKRRFEVMHRDFLDSQGDKMILQEIMIKRNAANGVFIDYRPKFASLDTTNERLRRILREDSSELNRETAWRSLNAIGATMGNYVINLAKLRNKLAKSLGYRDFYAMRLELNETDEKRLMKLFKKLAKLSKKPYEKEYARKLEQLDVTVLEPWDLNYDPSGVRKKMDSFFPKDQLLERVFSGYSGMGFDIDAMDIFADIEPREGKSPHAYSFPIDAPDDVRVLANIADGMGEAETLFHEYGHAVYSKGHRQEAWDLRAPASKAMTEGIGNFFGRVVEDRGWLASEAGVPDKLLNSYAGYLRRGNISRIRWNLVALYFEKALYEDPDQDLSRLWWDLSEKYLASARREDMAPWGRIIHYSTHPVYLQNYLLADMVCDQLWAYFETRGGVVGNAEVAAFMNEKVFRHGNAKDWETLLKEATGEPLNPKYYVRHRLGK